MSNEKGHNILFGTGDLFIVPEEIDLEEATEEEIEESLILVGESAGEASLILEQEFHDVRGGKDNQILASFRTEENITFNAGIVELHLENMSQFLPGEFSEQGDKKVLKLGGGYQIPVNRLRFVHYKKIDGKRLILDMHKAQNKAGLEMNFNNEEHSIFELEFTLQKSQNKDNIVTITEEI